MKFAGSSRVVAIFVLFALIGFAGRLATTTGAETHDLRPGYKPGDLSRTDLLVELKGDLQLKPSPDGETTTRPFQVTIRLRYDERVLEATPEGRILRSLRYYSSAEGEYRYGKLADPPEVTKFGPDWLLFDREGTHSLVCPRRLLFREEMEMLDVPGNTGFLADLLPEGPVAADATWSPADDLLIKLLAIDAIQENKVVTRIDSVDGDAVSLVTEGDVAGAASGVASDVKLRGRMTYSLKERRPTTFAMTWREIRSIGHAEPGFDVVATLRLATTRIDASEALADARIANVPRQFRLEMGLLKYEPPKKDFRLVQDRRWQTISATEQETVLRFINRGDLVAQCSIVRLPALKEGESLSLDDYQADVREKLGDNFSRFVDTKEFDTKHGVHVMKLLVEGRAEDIPIKWIYYHLTKPAGGRVALVFVHEPQFDEPFGDADRWIVENFEFLPAAEQASTSAAPSAQAAPEEPLR